MSMFDLEEREAIESAARAWWLFLLTGLLWLLFAIIVLRFDYTTVTAISSATAKAAKLDLNESPFGTMLSTANGDIAVSRSTVKKLDVGTITTSDLSVVVSPSFGDTDVLGMNFLSRLKGWRVEGDTLILQAGSDRS